MIKVRIFSKTEIYQFAYIFIALVVTIFISGCSGTLHSLDTALSTRGKITVTTSKIDDEKIVSMTPALTKHGLTDIQAEFGLYWDESKDKDALLIVLIHGANSFSPDRAMDFKVDGEKFSLKPASKTDYGDIETQSGSEWVSPYNETSKPYIVSKEQILKIANGKESYYRIWFLKGKFSEGEIVQQKTDYQSYVTSAFKTFYNEVWGSEL